ncbi:MAG: hypothetical protein WKG07_05535 [Hymenobacter sp.]
MLTGIPADGLALPPRQPLGPGVGARPVQRAHAQGPHHPRPLRHATAWPTTPLACRSCWRG